MSPFSITCTTCQQRLRVRDESAVGEIMICPKCGSMVLVESPVADVPPTTAPRSAPPAEDESGLPNEPLVPPPPAEPTESPPAAEPEAPPRADDYGADGAEALPPPVAAAEPGPPFAAGIPPAVTARRQPLLMAGAAIVGTALALAVVGYLVSRTSPADAPAPADGAPSAEPAPQATAPTPDAGPPPAPPDAAKPEPVPAGRPPAQADLPPASAPAPETPAKPEPAALTKTPPTPPPATGAKPDTPAAKPFSLEPAPKEEMNAAAALADTLRFLSPLTEASPPATSDPAPGPAAEGPKPGAAAPAADDNALPRPEPRNTDVEARLKDPLQEIDFPGTPLAEFCRMLSGFSTLPITLDPDALALVKATPLTPVSVKLQNTTVGGALAAALQPLGLAYTLSGRHLIVTRPPLPDGQRRKLAHPVGDLVDGDETRLQALATLVMDAVEPPSWEPRGGPGTIRGEMPNLIIEHQETMVFQAILLCEKLRTARHLPPQSKFDPALFTLEPRCARATRPLAKPVTVNFAQPTLLTRILDRLSRDTGVYILVDWMAVEELGWTPDGETRLSARGEPLGEVLPRLLKPMDLAYRVINATTVQVTTPALLHKRLEVEFYPVGERLPASGDPGALLSQIREHIRGLELAGVTPVVCFDPPSKCLIVALPQPHHPPFARWLSGADAARKPPPEPTP